MHLIVPFAAPLSEAGRQAAAMLRRPGLSACLARLPRCVRDEGDEWSLSPPHERAFARAEGWSGGDGELPFAARAAASDGIDVGDLAWGLLSPSHWRLGTEQVSLTDPEQLSLDDEASRRLAEAVAPLFTSEGFAFAYGAPTRWYVAHESLKGLATASPDRVIGRNVDRWLPSQPRARLMRRLQNEAQMLLHSHPENERREQRGLLPVNSFWLSGCGVAQRADEAAVCIDDRLRGAALAEDWAAWAKAWELVDESLRSAAVDALTLCGERGAITCSKAPAGWLERLASAWRRPRVATLLEGL